EDLALADQRAVRGSLAGPRMLQRARQADLRHQTAIVAEAPAGDVVVAVQVIGTPQHEHFAVGSPQVADVRKAARLLMKHHDALALCFTPAIERLAAERSRNAVLAGNQLDEPVADAVAKIVWPWLPLVVGDEDLRQAGILQHRSAAKRDIFEDQPVAQVDAP